jgi:hypothetical protein
MWPFSGGYQVLVQKKCEQRETLVAAALQFKPSDHAEYLKATGGSQRFWNAFSGQRSAQHRR